MHTGSWFGIGRAVMEAANRFRRFPRGRQGNKVLVLLAAGLACAAVGQHRAIDTRNSVVVVRVYKAGVFSALGHEHEIAAPVASGAVDTAALRVQVRIDTAALRVRDREASAEKREAIQKVMLGPDVLDVERYPEIVFRSTSVKPVGPDSWSVRGNLTLHGETQPVSLEVKEDNGHYTGAVALKQTDFGIKPVASAGGAVKVKDEIRIEFDIQMAR